MVLAVKTKTASCKSISDKSFLNTVALPTPWIEEVLSHPVRACLNRSFAEILDFNFFHDEEYFTFCYF